MSDLGDNGLYFHGLNTIIVNPVKKVSYYNDQGAFQYSTFVNRTVLERASTTIHEWKHKHQRSRGGMVASSYYLPQHRALISKVVEADAYAFSDYVMKGKPMMAGFNQWFSSHLRVSYERGSLTNSFQHEGGKQQINNEQLYRATQLPNGTNYLRQNRVNLFDNRYFGIAGANRNLAKNM